MPHNFLDLAELLLMARLHLSAAPLPREIPPIPASLKRAKPLRAFPLPLSPGLRLCLADPEHRLVVYGTLVPGGEYAHLLADLAGRWQECLIRGHMGRYRRYKTFKWNPLGPVHRAWLFTSPLLPARLPILDRFEGNAYRRRLIPALAGHTLVIANVYEGQTWA